MPHRSWGSCRRTAPSGPTTFWHACIARTAATWRRKSRRCRLRSPSYLASFRFVRPDGQEIWLEETGKAEFDAQRRYLRLKGLTRDITERKRAEERQRLLIRELDHRVKNALASVATVAQRTREGSGSMDEFLQLFDGRIQSMANAHALLSRNHWHGVSLADVVHSELAPYVGAGSVVVGGPEVILTAEATQPIAIVLHELVTNASKYGALTAAQGRISVRWDLPEERAQACLLLEWIETGGPHCRIPSQAGLRHPCHPQPHSLRTRRDGRPHLRCRRRALQNRAAVQVHRPKPQGQSTALGSCWTAAYPAQGCQQRRRGERLVQNGGEPPQRSRQFGIARNHQHLDAALRVANP